MFLAATAGVLVFNCMRESPVAGGASDTEVSAQVSGTVTDVYGTPVSGARVTLRLENYVPDEDTIEPQPGRYTRAEGVTDSEGFYQFDSIDTGTYRVSILQGDSVGTVSECRVGTYEPVQVESVLMPNGMVAGWVALPYEIGMFYSRARIVLVGSEQMERPDSNGFFRFSLPPGAHRLKFSVDSSFFDKVTIDVEVFSSQVKDIGVIRLNMLPPEPRTCDDFHCDSAILRNFLDDAGYTDVGLRTVSTWVNGRIESINLRGMDITVPLTPLGMLSTVRKLDLGKTGTTDSCRFIMGLWNLRELYLDSNAITGISRAFEGVYRIKVLDLSNNRLTRLPEKINDLAPDLELDLSGNELCTLPPHLLMWADARSPGWRETQRCP